MKKRICSIFSNEQLIDSTLLDSIESKIKKMITESVKNGYTDFLFCEGNVFDIICLKELSSIQKNHPNLRWYFYYMEECTISSIPPHLSKFHALTYFIKEAKSFFGGFRCVVSDNEYKLLGDSTIRIDLTLMSELSICYLNFETTPPKALDYYKAEQNNSNVLINLY